MFVIDRRDGNKVYYINSNSYRFHKDFLLANISFLAAPTFSSQFISTKTAALLSALSRGKRPVADLPGNFGKATWRRRR